MSATISAAAPAEIAALVSERLARWQVPGLAAGVLHNGQTQTWGFGAAALETGVPVRPDTLFQIGSISKIFCTTLLLNLVDDGLVDLDRPIVRYLPDLRLSDYIATGAVTVRHMLTHTSGIYGDLFDDFGWGDDSLARAVHAVRDLRVYTSPGELWAYCNIGFAIAGRVAEVVTGQPYEQAMRERIPEPLGLERTFYFPHEVLAYPHAVGSNLVDGPEPEIARFYWLCRAVGPAGGIYSTTGDLLKLAAFHMGDGTAGGKRVLSPESIRLMQTPVIEAGLAPHWGVGWDVREVGGVRAVGHGGSTNGFRAHLRLLPERGFAVALLTNGSQGGAVNRALDAALTERFTGLRATEPPAITLSPEALDAIAGRYVRPTVDLTLAVDGDALTITTTSTSTTMQGRAVTTPPRRAVPVDATHFRITEGADEGSVFDVIRTPAGRIRFLRVGGRLLEPEP